jgi:hypothetical protein
MTTTVEDVHDATVTLGERPVRHTVASPSAPETS